MKRFRVFYKHITSDTVDVYAENRSDAVRKAKAGDIIEDEDSPDSEPGNNLWKDAYAQEVEK